MALGTHDPLDRSICAYHDVQAIFGVIKSDWRFRRKNPYQIGFDGFFVDRAALLTHQPLEFIGVTHVWDGWRLWFGHFGFDGFTCCGRDKREDQKGMFHKTELNTVFGVCKLRKKTAAFRRLFGLFIPLRF